MLARSVGSVSVSKRVEVPLEAGGTANVIMPVSRLITSLPSGICESIRKRAIYPLSGSMATMRPTAAPTTESSKMLRAGAEPSPGHVTIGASFTSSRFTTTNPVPLADGLWSSDATYGTSTTGRVS